MTLNLMIVFLVRLKVNENDIESNDCFSSKVKGELNYLMLLRWLFRIGFDFGTPVINFVLHWILR